MPFAGEAAVGGVAAPALSRDLTSALARSTRYALVASAGSVTKVAAVTSDARSAGRELNVRYLVEGELRPQGDKVGVSLRFIDAATARELWNERRETDANELHAPAFVGALSNRVRRALIDAETRRASQQRGTTADATALWLRAVSADDQSLDGVRAQLRHLDEALRVDPGFASAWVSRTHALGRLAQLDPQADRDRLIAELERSSLRAVEADRNDPRAWDVRGEALTTQYRWSEAAAALDEVARIDPYRATLYTQRALLKIYLGQPQQAFAELDKAAALDPEVAGEVLRLQCRANLALGRYDDAIAQCERAATVSNVWWIKLYLTAAYAQAGRMDQAVAAKARLLQVNPGYTVARFRAYRPSDNADYWAQTDAHVLAGLRRAGIPEQ
jgi:adenylate cyclase